MGILEGEGTFLAGAPSSPASPVIRVAMTDEDVVARVGRLIDRAIVPLAKRASHHRRPFATTIRGAPAAALMRDVEPWLGVRRRAQITRALSRFDGRPLRWRRAEGQCSVVNCARPTATRGLCRHHYTLWWKATSHGCRPRYVPIEAATARSTIAHDPSACSSECDLGWLAGLLEGEGYFGSARTRNRTAYPVIGLQMCDEDVVKRAAELLRAPGVTRTVPRNEAWRPMFTTQVSGATAADRMREIRTLMGARRRAAIDGALAAYDPIRLIDPPETCVVPGCDAPHRSRGLCHKHYMRWMRDIAKGRMPRVTPLR